MFENMVALTSEELEAFVEYLKLYIESKISFYYTDAISELDPKDRADVRNDIDKYFALYDEVVRGKSLFTDYNEIRDIEIDMAFGIFDVLYELDPRDRIDNPTWLYTVLSVYNKFYDCVKEHDDEREKHTCFCDFDF